MATKDNNPGLLAKMARFMRNPTRDWSEPDPPEIERESGFSKEALKEMIERKRQNDLVRQREFDHLRKMRRNVPVISAEVAGRPSFFQSSMASNPDERATTLKKIDEIEAQMSKQWWKGKQEEASLHGDLLSGPPSAIGSGHGAPGVPAQALAQRFAVTQAPESRPGSEPLQDTDYGPTQMGMPATGEAALTHAVPLSAPPRGAISAGVEVAGSRFSSSRLVAIDLGESLADPELEEAAIRFANGDDAGAEAALLDALQAGEVDPDSAERWAAALFDLYRGTGQQASFDRVAIDCAQRFGRSAPGWFSTPELLGRSASTSASGQAALPTRRSQSAWRCPAALDLPALQSLQASLLRTPPPWQLNWRRLSSITPEAAQALGTLFAQWCAQPVQLQFDGADALERTLRQSTPSGDRGVDSCWWQLRLDALRILRLQDEFELAALDFCVTYEVSPPAWEPARCDCVCERMDTAAGVLPELRYEAAPVNAADAADGSNAPTVPMEMEEIPVAVVELSGEVLGDAAEALNQFELELKGAERLVVSCSRLIRVDFSAAGSILNWVAARQAEGCQVQFRDVPCLIAAFFRVIGINEYAKVILRSH